jgi:hypothetical protein
MPLAFVSLRTVVVTYKRDGFDWAPPNNPPDWGVFCVWFCVVPPNAPPKRPPLCGCVDCAVDDPKSPPLAGAVVAGLFRPPKSEPDCACCGCCAEPNRPPLLWGWLACCPPAWFALFPLEQSVHGLFCNVGKG